MMFPLKGEGALHYCDSIYQTIRRKTRQVLVGDIGVGGDNPIRIQSMTTSDTKDVDSTVEQIIKLANHGCEIVRVTVQGKKEALSCELIKNQLVKKGYDTPIVADIHFYPPAAMVVADFVDKIRINPGNFVDRRATFKTLEYNDETYAAEIRKIEDKLVPLIQKCKRLKKSIRIGTNHGSLSDRIMNRYGDSPKGMVESAFEFTRICRDHDFHDIIFSMKSSNPVVMVAAYRLLVAEMNELGWDYPLHLGVTEAGSGHEGRIKSAMGIGSLLLDGLGDTIRVSLTEDPWHEIDPCKRIKVFAENSFQQGIEPFTEKYRDFQALAKTATSISVDLPLHRDGSVFLSVEEGDILQSDFFTKIGCKVQLANPEKTDFTVDALVIRQWPSSEDAIDRLEKLKKIGIGIVSPNNGTVKLGHISDFNIESVKPSAIWVNTLDEQMLEKLLSLSPQVIILSPQQSAVHFTRAYTNWSREHNFNVPVVLNLIYEGSREDLVISAGAECGAILCDSLVQGVFIEANQPLDFLHHLSFNLLQGARMRSTKTEFISCPSCGRTLFNLQEVSERIRKKTSHLPGVKIAIMGCIVNGPGEMADADFGYVGSRPGMIDLYLGRSCVEKNIPFEEADEKLIELIKKHDRWVEPENIEIGV